MNDITVVKGPLQKISTTEKLGSSANLRIYDEKNPTRELNSKIHHQECTHISYFIFHIRISQAPRSVDDYPLLDLDFEQDPRPDL